MNIITGIALRGDVMVRTLDLEVTGLTANHLTITLSLGSIICYRPKDGDFLQLGM